MTFAVNDRVKETCSAPGTGIVTLLGAVSQFVSWSSGIGANNTAPYVIADQSGTNWEVGIGTVGSAGTTLTRTTVLTSSNANALVNFSSDTQFVWCDIPAKYAVLPGLGNSEFVSGTAMLFVQSTAPTGWTKSTAHDNKALRVVSGTAGYGGTVAFTTAFNATNTVDGTAITTAQMPAHNHGISDPGHAHSVYDPGHAHGMPTAAGRYNGANNDLGGGVQGSFTINGTYGAGTGIGIYGSGTGISTTNNGSGSTHSHATTNFAVQYVDTIICTKN